MVNIQFSELSEDLIDELDLHLHPKWQRQVVGDLSAINGNNSLVIYYPVFRWRRTCNFRWYKRRGLCGCEYRYLKRLWVSKYHNMVLTNWKCISRPLSEKEYFNEYGETVNFQFGSFLLNINNCNLRRNISESCRILGENTKSLAHWSSKKCPSCLVE